MPPPASECAATIWTLGVARYRTRPDEVWLSPVLTMQTMLDQVGTSWWDEVRIAVSLTPELETAYRREHPWSDAAPEPTARRLATVEGTLLWSERPEARLYPNTTLPDAVPAAAAIELAAPGNGHDLCQLVVRPAVDMAPLQLEFEPPTGPGPMPATALSCYVARCVEVTETLDPAFPKGRRPSNQVWETGSRNLTAGLTCRPTGLRHVRPRAGSRRPRLLRAAGRAGGVGAPAYGISTRLRYRGWRP